MWGETCRTRLATTADRHCKGGRHGGRCIPRCRCCSLDGIGIEPAEFAGDRFTAPSPVKAGDAPLRRHTCGSPGGRVSPHCRRAEPCGKAWGLPGRCRFRLNPVGATSGGRGRANCRSRQPAPPGPREGWARAAPGNRFRRPRFLHPTQLSRPTGSPARPAPQTSPRMPYLSPHIRRPASDTRAGTHHQPSTPALLMCSQGP